MAAEEKWYFTKEQLANTPSRRLGYDADKELSSRQQAANLIQDMGQRLQVTQLCINTAIVYMHRFYMFHSFTRFHRNPMAAAALFLAAKVEEQPRKLEHVIKVSQICLHREHPPMDVKSEAYIEQAQELVVNENILLQTLGFDVAIDHPHTHVVRCCHLVRASKELAQTSYFMASNSLHLTTMCLQYKPTEVACFCIHLACKWSNWEIPQSTEGKPWFWYVDRSVSQELLEQLTDEFLVMFEKCPSRLKKKIMSLSSTQNSTILSAFSNDGDKKRNGEGSSSNPNFAPGISFGGNSSDDLKKKQEYQRHHPDYKKHHIPHHSRPDSHNMQQKSSCMFGPPQRTQPPPGHTSSNSGSSGTSSSQGRPLPKPNTAQDVAMGKRDHLHHRPRRPEEKHHGRNHEPIPPPYKKYDKVLSGGISEFSQNSSNNVRSVGTTNYILPPSHQQPQLPPQPPPPPLPPQPQPPPPPQPQQAIQPLIDIAKPDVVVPHIHSINKHQGHSHVPSSVATIQKSKSPPLPPPTAKVERSIFSPEKSTPPPETSRVKVPSPSKPPPLTPGGTSRKRSISREPELAIYSKVEDSKSIPIIVHHQEQIKTETIISTKEEKPPDIPKLLPPSEPPLPAEPLPSSLPIPPLPASVPEESHSKEQKRKKKKHKERKDKKDKHKHKHKNRDLDGVLETTSGSIPGPIVITIPKEKLTLPQQPPEQGLKIKIAKDKIAPAISPASTGLKIKISKEKIKESKKRDRSEERNSSLPSKYHRPNGTTLQVNNAIDLMECSDVTKNDKPNLSLNQSSCSPKVVLNNNLSLSFDKTFKTTTPGILDSLLNISQSENCNQSLNLADQSRNNNINYHGKDNDDLVDRLKMDDSQTARGYHLRSEGQTRIIKHNNYYKSNYRGNRQESATGSRGRGRFNINNRGGRGGGYGMGGIMPPQHNFRPNFIHAPLNIHPPHGYNTVPIIPHPMMPYFSSHVIVPNFPPPPPLPDEPPPLQPPPPPPE